MTKEDLKKEIEKKFLGIRGWKNWKEYDDVQEATELDINTREELMNITIRLTFKKILDLIDDTTMKDYRGKPTMIHYDTLTNKIKEMMK